MMVRFATPAVLLAAFVGIGCTTSAPPASSTATPTSTPTPVGPVTPPATDEARLASAMSAAPAAVAAQATIATMEADGSMRTLREGTNGWTCLPDMPHTPGADPMCLDKNGMEWAHAWMSKKDPPAGKMGFGYMLVGGSDASNTDPFATAPASGGAWVETGPHVMVLNIGHAFDGYPTTATDTKVPYVMFPGTPYAHLMIPVK